MSTLLLKCRSLKVGMRQSQNDSSNSYMSFSREMPRMSRCRHAIASISGLLRRQAKYSSQSERHCSRSFSKRYLMTWFTPTAANCFCAEWRHHYVRLGWRQAARQAVSRWTGSLGWAEVDVRSQSTRAGWFKRECARVRATFHLTKDYMVFEMK